MIYTKTYSKKTQKICMLRHPLNIYDIIDLALQCDHIFN